MKEGVTMQSSMDERTFLEFYENSLLCYSQNLQRFICKALEQEHRITYDQQMNLQDDRNVLYFESKNDYKDIISKTSTNRAFINFYEAFEFKKLYKYSVPLFFEFDSDMEINDLFEDKQVILFDVNEYESQFVIDSALKKATPLVLLDNDKAFIKFVIQKTYVKTDTYEPVDYRYPIVIYIDLSLNILEIRYDSLKFGGQIESEPYSMIVKDCIAWLKNNLPITLFSCDHDDIISIINDKTNTDVLMYKQMMELNSGAAAELTASGEKDSILPFIGEIRELIDDNEDLFNESDNIKQLLLQYLKEKEETASYPYIYVKWIKPVVSKSYIVRITFDYFNNKYTLLQHITGNCTDLGMGRMNDAIKYLCESRSFVKGETI